ncbi:MAG: hypothetical protein ABSH06_26675 [Thermodesulfobacteriota bacterium]
MAISSPSFSLLVFPPGWRHASLIKTRIENVLGTPVEAIWSREGAEGLRG